MPTFVDDAARARLANLPPDQIRQQLQQLYGYSGADLDAEMTQIQGSTATGANLPGRSRESRGDALLGQNILDTQGLVGQAPGAAAGTAATPLIDPSQALLNDPRTGIMPFEAAPGEGVSLQEQAINQNRTDLTGANAATEQLSNMREAINAGGLTAIDRARLNQSYMQEAGQARGQREAVMARAEEQGRGGGNAQLLGQLQANQAGTNAQAQDRMNTMALGLARKDSLMGQAGTLGVNFQSINDAIDHFNAEGERARAAANVAAKNKAIQDTYGANEKRYGQHVQDYNQGAREVYNQGQTNVRANQTETGTENRYNAGPEQGARGAFRDKVGAVAAALAAREAEAHALGTRQEQKDQQSQAATAGWMGLAGSVLGTGAGVAEAALGAPKKPTP